MEKVSIFSFEGLRYTVERGTNRWFAFSPFCLGSTCSSKEKEGNEEEKKMKKREARLKLSRNQGLEKYPNSPLVFVFVGLSWVRGWL